MIRERNVKGIMSQDNNLKLMGKLGPAQILVGGFLAVIMIATLLLMLPISSNTGQMTSLLDALFTATSAVCVTGLSVVSTFEYWSLFGRVVILVCIQIGGLGFMTLVSMIFILMGKRITLRNRLIMQEAFSFNTPAGIVRFTKRVVKMTLFVEAIGALLLAFVFIPEQGFISGMGYAIFHSVSAFCNAGFDIVGPDSLAPYVGHGLVNITIMLLIILGGLGFTVWLDTYNAIKMKLTSSDNFTWRQAVYKLSLHTKLVWTISGILILVGFVFFFVMEYTNAATLGDLTLREKLYASLFQSVSSRTAGFSTIDLAQLRDSSKLMMMILMLIGGSPAGTAGGIKTVTVGALVLSALTVIKGKRDTIIWGRKIPEHVIFRALTVIMISIGVIFTMLMVLLTTEAAPFMDVLFEVVSAFATVGLTIGLTPTLTSIGKVVVIVLMFIGRLGSITMAVAFMLRREKQESKIQYPEERILVG